MGGVWEVVGGGGRGGRGAAVGDGIKIYLLKHV